MKISSLVKIALNSDVGFPSVGVEERGLMSMSICAFLVILTVALDENSYTRSKDEEAKTRKRKWEGEEI